MLNSGLTILNSHTKILYIFQLVIVVMIRVIRAIALLEEENANVLKHSEEPMIVPHVLMVTTIIQIVNLVIVMPTEPSKYYLLSRNNIAILYVQCYKC